jgi:phosphoglycerate dehydrogenase-like enzyme
MVKILAVSDPHVPKDAFSLALNRLGQEHEVRLIELDYERRSTRPSCSEGSISEYWGSPSQLIEEIDDYEILVVHRAPVTSEVIRSGRALRLIGCARGGPVNVDVAAATEQGIPLVRAPGRNADAVADFTIGLLLAEARSIARAHTRFVNEGVWRFDEEGKLVFRRGIELLGKTLGLIGFGKIGTRVAARAKGFGMRILVYDPYVSREVEEEFGVELVDLDNVMSESDFVSVHARATKGNVGLIGEEQIRLMKKNSILINTARASLVDYSALYESLRDRRILGAALDVYPEEPVDPASPLFRLDNVTLTPHLAGTTREVPLRGVMIVLEDILRYLRGKPLMYVQNPEVLSGSRPS